MSELKGGYLGTQMVGVAVSVHGHADIKSYVFTDCPESGDTTLCLHVGHVSLYFYGAEGLVALRKLAQASAKASDDFDAAIVKASSPVVEESDPVCVKCGRTALVNLGSKGWSCHGCLYDSDGMSGQGE